MARFKTTPALIVVLAKSHWPHEHFFLIFSAKFIFRTFKKITSYAEALFAPFLEIMWTIVANVHALLSLITNRYEFDSKEEMNKMTILRWMSVYKSDWASTEIGKKWTSTLIISWPLSPCWLPLSAARCCAHPRLYCVLGTRHAAFNKLSYFISDTIKLISNLYVIQTRTHSIGFFVLLWKSTSSFGVKKMLIR